VTYGGKGKTAEWGTPPDVFKSLDAEFHFTLDPCANDKNHKCDKYYTKDDDGLTKSWKGEVVFMNPPYGKAIAQWVQKAYMEALGGTTVVCLLPVNTDTGWFQDYIYHKAEIRFPRGRINFVNEKGETVKGSNHCSMFVIYTSESVAPPPTNPTRSYCTLDSKCNVFTPCVECRYCLVMKR